MPEAYVLINCRLGNEDRIIRELKGIRGVVEASGVYGLYDIVAKVRADTQEEFGEIVAKRMKKIANIVSTNTLIVVEGLG